jgi:hypothetical protein
MHKVSFYPLGNADSYLIELEKGKKLLFDFANKRNPDDEGDKRLDLAAELNSVLDDAERDFFDVVAFTHLDDDHIHGASEFFSFDHAEKYEGGERVKIIEMWVPAAAILEEGLDDEARIIRQEARHRLKNGAGIRVFSRPDALAAWLEANGLTLESRRHLISNAGKLVSGFDKGVDGVEFFVHSPFSKHCDDGEIDRNTACLGFQATFDTETQLLMTADATHETWEDIVNITKAHGNESRLKWDILKVPHHCSYLSLGPDKGAEKTSPTENVRWLLEQGKPRSHLVVPSDPIPSSDTDQPPHRQAYKCYEEFSAKHGGQLLVTMEWPSPAKPEKILINIDRVGGATHVKRFTAPSIVVTSRPLRAG